MNISLNKTEAHFLITSRLPIGDVSGVAEFPEGHPYCKYEFEPGAVLIGISFFKDVVNRLKNKTSINSDSIKNAILDNISGGVYLHTDSKSELVNLMHYDYPDTFGFIILYHIKDVLINCFASLEEGVENEKSIIQAYRKCDYMAGQYAIVTSHVSSNHLVNKAPDGEILLLKDLIQRLVLMFEYPFDTKCTKETNYIIRQIENEKNNYIMDNRYM
jgi:hypothetical protein